MTSRGAEIIRWGNRFLRWWLSEILDLVPKALRRRFSGKRGSVAVRLNGDSLRLCEVRGAQEREVVSVQLGDMNADRMRGVIAQALLRKGLAAADLILRLPDAALLRREESYPAIVEKRLAKILALDANSASPLAAGQMYSGYHILERDEENGRIRAEQVLVKKAAVDELATRLEGLGIHLSGAIPENVRDAPPTLNLLPPERRRQRPPLWTPLNRGLAVLACVLAVVALAMSFYRQEAELGKLSFQLEQTRIRAQKVLAMRAEADRLLKSITLLSETKAAAPQLMVAYNELSRILPDGAWVTDFRMRGDEIQIVGQSRSAATLLGLIERSPLFTDARFGSPVVRDQRTGAERFNVQFKWAHEPDSARTAEVRKGDGE